MFHTTLRCGKLDKIGLLERDRSPILVPKTAAMASVTTPQKKSRAGYRQSPCPNGERAVFTAPESTGSRHRGTRTSHSHLCITRKKWKKQCHASRIPASVPATSRSAGHSLTYLVGKEFPSLSLSREAKSVAPLALAYFCGRRFCRFQISEDLYECMSKHFSSFIRPMGPTSLATCVG